MYSLEYTKTLLPDTQIDLNTYPHLLVVQPIRDLPGEVDLPGQVVLLDRTLSLVGRDSICRVKILDRYVSRIHASITRVLDQDQVFYWLRDGDGHGRDSANGTFLNSEKLDAAQLIQDRDGIRVGIRVISFMHAIGVPTPEDQDQQQDLLAVLGKAGLLTEAQIEEARETARTREMLPGEVAIVQEWVRPETIEFFSREQPLPLPESSRRHLIGEYLKAAGLVTEGQIVEALRLQKRTKMFFGMALVEKGQISEQTLEFFLNHYGESEQQRIESDTALV